MLLSRKLSQSLIAISCKFNSSSANNKAVLPFDAIPGPSPLPCIGNIWRYLPLVGDYNIDELYKNALFNKKRYGPIVREQITKKHVVLHLFDPDDIRAFFWLDGSEPYRRSHRALLKFRHDNPKRYNDGGIFPENGANWSRLRKLFNRYLMKKSQVEMRCSILDDITKQTLAACFTIGDNNRSPVIIEDFARLIHFWTIKCALAVFLDYSWSSMPEQQVLERILGGLDDLLDAIAGTEIKSERWTTQPGKCPYYQKLSKVEAFTYEFVQHRIEHLLESNSFNDISYIRNWLIDDQMDRVDVITFILDCLLASVHTTAYTTTFLLENISRKLDERYRLELQQEIFNQLPSSNMTDFIGNDIFNEMPLLKACFKETLRLHPISIGTGRLTQQDMIIRGYHIPKGVMVIAHNQLICRESSHYENPDQYCPTRWLDHRSRAKSRRPSGFAWLPFGFGPRICLGQRLVDLQIKIFASRLLQNFDINFYDDEIKTKTMLVNCLDGKIRAQLSPKPSSEIDNDDK